MYCDSYVYLRMNNNADSTDTVSAVERAFSVIRALRELNGAGVTELSNKLGMSKSGIHKQLSTLVSEGYVTNRDGVYRLSFKFIADSEYVKNASTFYTVGSSETKKLASESQDCAYLTAIEAEQAYCIFMTKGENAVATDVAVGNQISFHSSAAGKAILSQLPTTQQERLIEQGLPQQTEQTVTTVSELRTELETIQAEGIAYEDEENVRGIRSVSAPILSPTETVLGAVSVSGPVALLTDDRFETELPDRVRKTKNFIEVKFSLKSRNPIQDGSHVPKDFY